MFVAPFRGGISIPEAHPDAILTSRGHALVRFDERQAFTPVIFCDAGYFEIHFMNFIEGGPWHESEADIPFIVLNDRLAWYLFGGLNVTGMYVRIGDEFFRIIGIVNQYDEYMAWLPRINSDMDITSMYIPTDSPIDTFAEVHGILENGFAIVDINRYVESIRIRHRILLYCIWFWIMILLFLKAKDAFLLIPFAGGIAVAIMLLAGINNILLWMPNFLDPSTTVLGTLSNIGLLPPEAYLPYGLRMIRMLNYYGNFAWAAGTIGLINLIFCNDIKKH